MKKIFNKKNSLIYAVAIISLCFLAPSKVMGATISASSEGMLYAGDTNIIGIYLDTEGDEINSIDGSIKLSDSSGGNFEIKDFNLTGSIFSIWLGKPSADTLNNISFIGGVPNGIKGERLLLFKIIIKINKKGDFTIEPSAIKAFKNDGKATMIPINKNKSIIQVGEPRDVKKDSWQEKISSDNIAPLPFKIDLVQDANLYGGKKFIMFETTDDVSGIDYYKVKEGDREPVISGTSYILIDQESKEDIIVFAYDKAGNFQTSKLVQKDQINWPGIILAVVAISIIIKIIKFIIKRRKNVKQ